MEDGAIRVNQRPLDLAQLGTLLNDIAEQFPGQPVLIRADQTTSFQHVIAVLDLCRQADIWNISFATRVSDP
jgi:biopolymer transport protein ExbD